MNRKIETVRTTETSDTPKTAVITGGTRGIGLATAVRFAAEGYRLVLIYNSDDPAAERAAEILRKSGADAVCRKCDVSDHAAVMDVSDEIIRRCGRADVLINNAGISQIKMFTDITEQDWDRMFGVNVKGIYNCCAAFLPGMISAKRGRIVNISSIWGITGASCEVHYSASKSAVIGFTKALAKELGPSGITVNCVAPGVIDTDMNAELGQDVLDKLADGIPLCRLGTAGEAANAVFFLASPEASYITGQVITVDGGMI